MKHRTLILNVISAHGLNKVNFITEMDVYAVVYISGGGKKFKQKTKTHVHKDGGCNPSWNFPMRFNIEESAAQQNRLTLVFKLKCDRVFGDKDIGEVNVPIKELIQSVEALGKHGNKQHQFVSYQVRKPSGKPKGHISISYVFGGHQKVLTAAPPAFAGADALVMAYPTAVIHIGSSSVCPPPSPRYGYQGSPTPKGYGYRYGSGYTSPYHQGAPPLPPPTTYGYPPSPPPPPPSHGEYDPSAPPEYGYPPVQRKGLGN